MNSWVGETQLGQMKALIETFWGFANMCNIKWRNSIFQPKCQGIKWMVDYNAGQYLIVFYIEPTANVCIKAVFPNLYAAILN